MAEKENAFILFDGHIISLLNGSPLRPRRPLFGHLAPFMELEHMDLMYALVHRKYPTAASILNKLTAPLPPKDAAAACLCALSGSEKLMHTILDHSPPIPEFQFLGVGAASSLLNTAARYGKHKMLDLLLRRGASPDGGPTPRTAATPLEAAFCSNSYLCLVRLLKCPDLTVELTHNMLVHWANLAPDIHAPCPADLMCAQVMLECLTGQPVDLQDPLPFPAQMRLKDPLEHLNLPLATHICKKRPLTDEEKATVIRYFSSDDRITLLDEQTVEFYRKDHQQSMEFLLSALENCPELVRAPAIRFAIAAAALSLPKPEETMQRWVSRLEDGPIFLQKLSAGGCSLHNLSSPILLTSFTLSEYFFPRWDQRLGHRLVPTMDVSASLKLDDMVDEDFRLVLDRVAFVGERPADQVSHVSQQFLLHAPEHMLPELLLPGGLLTREAPAAMLDFCMDLPAHRRNFLLPYLHKNVNYDL